MSIENLHQMAGSDNQCFLEDIKIWDALVFFDVFKDGVKLLKSRFDNIECNPDITSALRYTFTQVLHGPLINNIEEHILQKQARLMVFRYTHCEQRVLFLIDYALYIFHTIGLEEQHAVPHCNG